MADPASETNEPALQIPLPVVARFVRQLSHDLRNHLNAAELQSAYLNELAEEPELKTELQRLRGMLSEMGGSLHRLTSSLAPVKLTAMPYEAQAFVEDLKQKVAAQSPAESRAIEWAMDLGAANLEIDPQLLQAAFLQLIANAFQHARGEGQLCVRAETAAQEFIFTLCEPKKSFVASTENWGREPFGHVGQGHYGLGLYRARHIIEAHRGRMDVRYDQPSASLVTVVAFPLLPVG